MVLPKLDRDSQEPMYRQLYQQIMRLIDEGSLPAGERLPPTRVLAEKLAVNRTTVCRAYQELWALGYLESRPGGYSTVRARMRPVAARKRPGASLIDWDQATAPESRRICEDLLAHTPRPVGASEPINFSGLAADRELCPLDDFRRSLKHALATDGKRLLDYGDPAGYPPLREVIARRMRTHGVTVTAEEILITGGSQQALDLVVRLITRPLSCIAVESPTYSHAIPLFRFHGLLMQEAPMRPDGLDLDVLADWLATQRPALVYTIPNFHNPTGITTSQAHREALLAMCERHRVPILEDGFEEEMKYFGKAVLPIKSMDEGGIVIYLGTFSKVVFPGLRVGWIAADRECIKRLLALSRFSNLSGSMLGQAALAHFCEDGHYEQYLRRVHGAYRRRMQAMLHGLRQYLPERGVEWTQPAGGYTLWVKVAPTSASITEKELLERLRQAGVLATPGRLFFPAEPDGLGFRLSISNLREPQIHEGCRRLGRALASVVGG
ncbi:MAG: PLP-dependent aminotransferase family protein [Acidobacteriota bacterium]